MCAMCTLSSFNLFDYDDDLFILCHIKLCVHGLNVNNFMYLLYIKIGCKDFTDCSAQVYKALKIYALWFNLVLQQAGFMLIALKFI